MHRQRLVAVFPFHFVQGMSEGFPRLVNVAESALLQPAMSSLISPEGDVPACFIQKSQCRTQGAIGVSPALRRGSMVGVPSLVAHRLTYFMDGAFNFFYGAVPRADKSRTAIRLQQFTRFSQVREGMEIAGTLGLSLCSQSK